MAISMGHDLRKIFKNGKAEAMNVCLVFWKDNVDILPRNKQNIQIVH